MIPSGLWICGRQVRRRRHDPLGWGEFPMMNAAVLCWSRKEALGVRLDFVVMPFAERGWVNLWRPWRQRVLQGRVDRAIPSSLFISAAVNFMAVKITAGCASLKCQLPNERRTLCSLTNASLTLQISCAVMSPGPFRWVQCLQGGILILLNLY